MEPREITPEEALSIAEDPEMIPVAAGLASISAADNPGVMGGMIMLIGDIISGNCTCAPCTGLRQMFSAADAQLDRLLGGLPA